jgi:hypothetical protein
MDANNEHLLILGLPETGKSSFVQALDEVLKNPSSKLDLRSFGLADDRSYLERQKETFHAGEELDRTDRQIGDTLAELWFEEPISGKRCKLHLPDKKGEIFRDQWVYRRWAIDFKHSLKSLSGALIFIRADEKSQTQELLGALAQQRSKPTEANIAWDMRNASAQVQLVDILQFISELATCTFPLRLAIIISAWDTIENDKTGFRTKEPVRHMEREWALLDQFLHSNPDKFEFNAYGVSAYGGVPGELGKLLELPAHKRVRLVDGLGIARDFTSPLKWLLRWQ